MVDLAQLKKPASKKTAATPVKVSAEQKAAPALEPAPAPRKNLHRPDREKNVGKQFMLPSDVILDFEIEARKQGFKRDSHFFLHVWETFKAGQR